MNLERSTPRITVRMDATHVSAFATEASADGNSKGWSLLLRPRSVLRQSRRQFVSAARRVGRKLRALTGETAKHKDGSHHQSAGTAQNVGRSGHRRSRLELSSSEPRIGRYIYSERSEGYRALRSMEYGRIEEQLAQEGRG